MKFFRIFSFFSHSYNKRTRNVFYVAWPLFLIVITGTIIINIIIEITVMFVDVIITINIIKKRINQNIRHFLLCCILSFSFFLIKDLRKNKKKIFF